VSPAAGPWPPLGIVVPVYNESATIEHALRAMVAVAERYEGTCRVIAVDDGSKDDSLAILLRLEQEMELLDVDRNEVNQGYGAALRTGARRARADGLEYAAFIDSDLTNPPEDVLRIGALAAQGHRYIKASRFIPGGTMGDVPWRRRIWSVAGNELGAFLFGAGIKDVTNGFRAVRLTDHARWPLRETGFASIVEELDWALRDGLEVVEFPSVLTVRTADQRASAFPYSGALIRAYLRYPLRALRRRLSGSTRQRRQT
jgi:glycosyltransferase involved in cell wall biosynthesis